MAAGGGAGSDQEGGWGAARSSGCARCGSATYIQALFDAFGERICTSCKSQTDDFQLVSRSVAKSQYLLPDSSIAPLRTMERPNPSNPKFRPMRLLLLLHVRAAAVARWGSLQAMEEEYRRRQVGRLERSTAASSESGAAAPSSSHGTVERSLAALAAAAERALQDRRRHTRRRRRRPDQAEDEEDVGEEEDEEDDDDDDEDIDAALGAVPGSEEDDDAPALTASQGQAEGGEKSTLERIADALGIELDRPAAATRAGEKRERPSTTLPPPRKAARADPSPSAALAKPLHEEEL
jgi:hypothetical protein